MQAAPAHRPLLALLIRLGAVAVLATMSALIKLTAQRGVHLLEIMFWRQFLTVPMFLGWAMLTSGGIGQLRTARPGTQFQRSAYGTLGMLLNFGAVILLPLAEATTLSFTAPIWAVILSMVLLKEKIGVWRWGAVIGGFAGIVIIAQPGGGHIPLQGALLGLGGAFLVALISLQIADLNRTDKPLAIVFYFALSSAPMTAVALPFVAQAHSAGTWLLIGAIGLTGAVGQLLLTAALRFGTVASVIVMDYSALVWATLYGVLFFGVLPPATTWLGAPLVAAAGIVIAWREHRLSRATNRAIARVEGT